MEALDQLAAGMRKSKFHWITAACLFPCVITLTSSCDRDVQGISTSSSHPFTITNLRLDSGQTSWMVEAPNGIVVEFQPDNVAVYFKADSTTTVWYNPTNGNVLKTLLEIPGSQGVSGRYVRDSNADGVPDLLVLKDGMSKSAFIRGQWCPLTYVDEVPHVTIDGGQVKVTFDGARFIESSD